MKYFTTWITERPMSFYIGWFGLVLIGSNHYFYPNQFLYSNRLSFLTSNFSGLIVFMFFFLSALGIINYGFRKKQH